MNFEIEKQSIQSHLNNKTLNFVKIVTLFVSILVSGFAYSNVTVTFQVDMSAVDTINTDGVYVAGGSLGQEGHLLSNSGNNIYSVTLILSSNTTYLYKFRNQPSYGTWDGFEDSAGLIAGNCVTGDYSDRYVDVGSANMVLDVVAYGSCPSGSSDPSSGTGSSGVASWAAFGGATITESTLEFPSGAESWSGYANINDDIYPLSFPDGGVISFTASSNSAIGVRFRFEKLPFPDVDPAFDTSSVTVSGSTETTYSIAIPSGSNNSYESLILYLTNRDIPVTIKNVQVSRNNNQIGCSSSSQNNSVIKVEAECFSLENGIQIEDTTDTGGGQNIGYIDAFDSMTYVVNVPSTSNYIFNYRTASQNGSSLGFRVFVDNQYADVFAIPSSGGWQNWQSQQGRVVALTSGTHIIRFDAASAGMNLNWFSLTQTNAVADEPPINGNDIDVDGVPIDSTKWFHQTLLPKDTNGDGSADSWFNDELQHYTDRTENSYVSDGTLKIVARSEAYTNQDVTKQYTSARLNSKFAFQYGVVEFRAKMPVGAGTWPAVWMLGKSISETGTYWASQGYGTTSWPAVGEIDILEHWGSNPGYAQSAMHTTSSYGGTINHGGRSISNISSEFHTYSMDWNASRIIFKIDGIEHYRYNPSVKNADTWPYDSEFFLLLNVAIEPNIVSGFTQSQMEVDYIRVYESGSNDLVWSDEFNSVVDSDGDGVLDDDDAFPDDSSESVDTDGDGIGDNEDVFPNNSNETTDTDGDGVGDNSDVFPDDASESVDTDADGVGDNSDVFPDNDQEWLDTDGDGTGDNSDMAPLDPSFTTRSQIVSILNTPTLSPGKQFTLDVNYEVSTNNNKLTGLGLRIHFDSTKLSFTQVSEYIEKDNIFSGSMVELDVDNFDNNQSTDSYVSLAWASVNGDWPNQALPANLFSIDFAVAANVAQQFTEYTTIGFSKSSNSEGFVFAGDDYQLIISPANWDFDKNGTADALSDGLMMLRHAFGLRGEFLVNGAVAQNSPLTNEEVEQSINSSMVIADIDNNGQVDALTDGLLLLRYLFGITGSALIDGAIGQGSTRSTHSDVQQYIQDHMPGQNTEAPDNTAPEITLNGDAAVGLAIGDNYVELGAVANDATDGDVNVIITGSIGTTLGSYTLTYTAIDSAGNSSSVSRTITVDQAPNMGSFKFLRSNNPDLINDVILDINTNTITGRIPVNTSVKQLIASFEHDGTNISVFTTDQENSSTVNDFTQPVVYKISKPSGVSKSYSVDVTKFTGLPIVNITTENFVSIDSKENYVNGTVSVDGGRYISDMDSTAIEIRGRGNSTWGIHPKKPYQMKFASKEEFLDMPEDKKWIFLAEYSDKTLVRNTTAFEMGYISNLDWTPKSEYAEVYINNDYQGTYNITQKVEETNRRVAITNDGYLLEIDQLHRLDDDDVYFSTNSFNVIAIKEPSIDLIDETGLSFTQDPRYTYINSFVNQFEDALFGSNFASTVSGYAAYIDVDSFVDWYLINEIIKNQDARWYSSIFFHLIPGEKIKMGPLWDHDLGFGNVDYDDTEYTYGWWIKQNPWIGRLLQDPNFVTKVRERFNFFRDNQQFILEKIDFHADRLQWSQQENDNKWQTLGQYVWPNPVFYETYQEEVDHLKQWYQDRMDWLESAINSLNGDSQPPADNVSVTFQVDMNLVDTNTEGVYLAGGDLGQTGFLMTDNGSDVWSITIPLQANASYMYKFRNQPSYGTWDGFESGVGLYFGGCSTGTWDDRFIDVGNSDIVIGLVAYGSCTENPF
ncbi:MAG: CotH kinase family protein [Porticoccaceae bacterium]|nr:CotH kinase family protein [Porticoccaceae bacterium]